MGSILHKGGDRGKSQSRRLGPPMSWAQTPAPPHSMGLIMELIVPKWGSGEVELIKKSTYLLCAAPRWPATVLVSEVNGKKAPWGFLLPNLPSLHSHIAVLSAGVGEGM